MTFQKHLDWLITMSKHPAWKAYAWKRAQDMDADLSGLFTGIKDALVKAMREQSNEGGSALAAKSPEPKRPRALER